MTEFFSKTRRTQTIIISDHLKQFDQSGFRPTGSTTYIGLRLVHVGLLQASFDFDAYYIRPITLQSWTCIKLQRLPSQSPMPLCTVRFHFKMTASTVTVGIGLDCESQHSVNSKCSIARLLAMHLTRRKRRIFKYHSPLEHPAIDLFVCLLISLKSLHSTLLKQNQFLFDYWTQTSSCEITQFFSE